MIDPKNVTFEDLVVGAVSKCLHTIRERMETPVGGNGPETYGSLAARSLRELMSIPEVSQIILARAKPSGAGDEQGG